MFETPYVVSYQVGMIKRDHIRRTLVIEERFVDARHLRRADEVDAQLELFERQQFVEQRVGDLAQ